MSTQTEVEHYSAARTLAYGLGWFSIGLGALELLKARQLEKGIGARGGRPVLRVYGVREILTGMAILSSSEPNKLVWARVMGDILDLATLTPTFSTNNPQRPNALGAVAFVAGATLLDLYVASLDSRRSSPRIDLSMM